MAVELVDTSSLPYLLPTQLKPSVLMQNIAFVGAKGRMGNATCPCSRIRMIKGLPICGFDRKILLKNFAVLFKIWKSQRMAKKIIRIFKPMAAVGVGGMPAAQLLRMCKQRYSLLHSGAEFICRINPQVTGEES